MDNCPRRTPVRLLALAFALVLALLALASFPTKVQAETRDAGQAANDTGAIDSVTILLDQSKRWVWRDEGTAGIWGGSGARIFGVAVEGTAEDKGFTVEMIGNGSPETRAYTFEDGGQTYVRMYIAPNETADVVTVRATSTFDPSVYGDAAIEIRDKVKLSSIDIKYDTGKLTVLTPDMTGASASTLLNDAITSPKAPPPSTHIVPDVHDGWYVKYVSPSSDGTCVSRLADGQTWPVNICYETENLSVDEKYYLSFEVYAVDGYIFPDDGAQVTVNGRPADMVSGYRYQITVQLAMPCKEKVAAPEAASFTYDGSEKTGVAAGEGYVVENGSATDAGSYTATATLETPDKQVWVKGGKLVDRAALELPWKISPASIKDAKIDPIPDQEWKGTPVEPKPVVKLAGKTLSEGADYTLSYSGNAKAGAATVTATGKGNYAGTAKATFKIAAPEQLWKRLAGKNALFTMREIVREGFSEKGGAVVIATNASFKDALSAAALAGKHGAPILMTPPDKLSAVTASEIKRLAPATAYIVGGELAVSKAVEDEVAAMGATVERVAGRNAADTSVEVAKKVGKSATAIVATSADFADALSIAPWAYANRAPIILTNGKGQLTQAGLSRIKSMGAKRAVVVGGTIAVSQESEDMLAAAGVSVVRLAGATAVRTSAAVAAWELGEGFSLARVACATRTSYKDALAGSALMGQLKGPILLVNGANYSAVRDTLKGKAAQLAQGYFLGGEAVIPADVASRIEAIK